MPKVSVIIPVYNVEKYLRECLDSVINQTLNDLEIICINDGSTDGCLDILNEYASRDSRIRIINKENGGLSAARNDGIMQATGEYIGFVDSDDWISPDFYENLYSAAVKYKADIACGDLYRTGNGLDYYIVRYKKTKVAKSLYDKFAMAYLPKHNYVMNRIYDRMKLQKKKLLFEEGILFEDTLFSHKVFYYLNKCVAVPNTKYYYRNVPFSIMNNVSERSEAEHRRELYKSACFVAHNNIPVKYKKSYHFITKKQFDLFNIPIFVIRKYCYFTVYSLFGFIPVLTTYQMDYYDPNS